MMDKLYQAFNELKVVNMANDIGVNYHTIYSWVDKKIWPKNVELLTAMDQWLTARIKKLITVHRALQKQLYLEYNLQKKCKKQ